MWLILKALLLSTVNNANHFSDNFLVTLQSICISSSSLGMKFTHFLFFRYKSLDVRNILMETVSHHILPQMLASPLWADLSNLLKDYLKFMDDHFRESADLTFLAYCHKNYSKVCIYLCRCSFKSALVPVFHFYPRKGETKKCGFLIISLSEE